MATKTIKWNEGEGNIIASYSGIGSAILSLACDIENEGLDREQEITIATTDGEISTSLLVKQSGKREIFSVGGADFTLYDGATFNVLK